MKKCPYCAEEIQNDAKFCRYCKNDVDLSNLPETTISQKVSLPDEETPKSKSTNKTLIIILVVVAVIIAIVLIKRQIDLQVNDIYNQIQKGLAP